MWMYQSTVFFPSPTDMVIVWLASLSYYLNHKVKKDVIRLKVEHHHLDMIK